MAAPAEQWVLVEMVQALYEVRSPARNSPGPHSAWEGGPGEDLRDSGGKPEAPGQGAVLSTEHGVWSQPVRSRRGPGKGRLGEAGNGRGMGRAPIRTLDRPAPGPFP